MCAYQLPTDFLTLSFFFFFFLDSSQEPAEQKAGRCQSKFSFPFHCICFIQKRKAAVLFYILQCIRLHPSRFELTFKRFLKGRIIVIEFGDKARVKRGALAASEICLSQQLSSSALSICAREGSSCCLSSGNCWKLMIKL